jgi:membrane protease YdiL (CAAX protease family)
MSDGPLIPGMDPRVSETARPPHSSPGGAVALHGAPILHAVRAGGLRALAAVYCMLIVAGMAVGAALGAVATAVLDSILLVALIDHFVIGSRIRRATRLLPALALVPLLQLASLALAVRSPLVSLSAAGAPILLATTLAAREAGLFPLLRIGDFRRFDQWAPAMAAVPLGAAGVFLFGSHPLQRGAPWDLVLAGCVVVFIFAGLLEELVFRGVIQRALGSLGASSVLFANLLFTAVYLASGSVVAVLVAAGGGALAGWWTRRTGSVAGAALAHGVLAAGYLVLWPALL